MSGAAAPLPDFDLTLGRLRAVAEPTRLRVLALVRESEFSVKELTQLLGQSQPRVSRHVKLLADAGLVERTQEGSWVFVRASRRPEAQSFIASVLGQISPSDPVLEGDRERAERLKAARAEEAQAYFAANAERWDEIRSLHVPEGAVEEAMRQALGEGPFELLLDLGTGSGRMLEIFAGHARHAIGVDVNRAMLACARARIDQQRLTNCSLRHADIYHLPFPDRSADAIIVHQVLHYLEAPDRALLEASRVLKPGGRLLVVDFSPHQIELLRQQHAHRRLGFSGAEVGTWLAEAGLSENSYRELKSGNEPQTRLTVALWLAAKPGAETRVRTQLKAREGVA